MAMGPFFWIDRALLKLGDGTVDLDTTAIKAALLSSSQAVARGFTGSSGDARYADLTGELATASGYTAGGVALSSVVLSRLTASRTRFTSANIAWTLTASITFKYLVLYADGATNKDLLMVADMDTSGGSLIVGAGALTFIPDSNGWGYWEQP